MTKKEVHLAERQMHLENSPRHWRGFIYKLSIVNYWGILPVVKYCSISSRVRPLVSGMKKAAVMK